MPESTIADHYETLQLSPSADHETIERVFRLLAHRYHPDNLESGNADRFTELVNAHTVLGDPEKRAAYDLSYERIREARWRIFDQSTATSDIATDAHIRLAMLSLLYVARRNNYLEPGIGIVELERVLACPTEILQFQMWYLRENGWVERLTSGHFAITAAGVDKLFTLGGPQKAGPFLLRTGNTPRANRTVDSRRG